MLALIRPFRRLLRYARVVDSRKANVHVAVSIIASDVNNDRPVACLPLIDARRLRGRKGITRFCCTDRYACANRRRTIGARAEHLVEISTARKVAISAQYIVRVAHRSQAPATVRISSFGASIAAIAASRTSAISWSVVHTPRFTRLLSQHS